MEIVISKDSKEASARAAEVVKKQLRDKRASVLGLATGGTVLELYCKLVEMCKNGELSLKKSPRSISTNTWECRRQTQIPTDISWMKIYSQK